MPAGAVRLACGPQQRPQAACCLPRERGVPGPRCASAAERVLIGEHDRALESGRPSRRLAGRRAKKAPVCTKDAQKVDNVSRVNTRAPAETASGQRLSARSEEGGVGGELECGRSGSFGVGLPLSSWSNMTTWQPYLIYKQELRSTPRKHICRAERQLKGSPGSITWRVDVQSACSSENACDVTR